MAVARSGFSERDRKELANYRDRIFDSSADAERAFERLIKNGCDRDGLTAAIVTLLERVVRAEDLSARKALDPWKTLYGLSKREVFALPSQLEVLAKTLERLHAHNRVARRAEYMDSSQNLAHAVKALPATLNAYAGVLRRTLPGLRRDMSAKKILAHIVDDGVVELIGLAKAWTGSPRPPLADLATVLCSAPVPDRRLGLELYRPSGLRLGLSTAQFSRKALQKLWTRRARSGGT